MAETKAHNKDGDIDVDEAYFFGMITRADAEAFLLDRGRREGTFLVRGGEEDGYRLSLLLVSEGKQSVIHYRIVHAMSNRTYSVEPGLLFGSVKGLIIYYSDSSCDDLGHHLTDPCPKEDQSLPLGLQSLEEDEVIMTSLLHEGKGANIWRGNIGGNAVVIKVILNDKFGRNLMLQEANCLHLARHPNVIELIGIIDAFTPRLMFSHCHQGDVLHYMLESGTYEIPFFDRLEMVLQVTSAVEHVTSHGFVHRNIRANNLLLEQNRRCKLAGFSHARKLDEDGIYYARPDDPTFPPTSVRWMAVEASTEDRFSVASDIWSLAALMVEIFSNGEPPFANEITMQIAQRVQKGHRPRKPQCVPDAIFALMLRCWYPDVNMRPDFAVIKETLKQFRNTEDPVVEDDNYITLENEVHQSVETPKKEKKKKKNKVRRYLSMAKTKK